MNKLRTAFAVLVAAVLLAGCGGHGDGPELIRYPFEDVYGNACVTYSVKPGCTFNLDGTRVTVRQDDDYNYAGHGSDDLLYVDFDGAGVGAVYSVDHHTGLGVFEYYVNVNEFAGYIGGTTIGVGTSGTYWEDVANGTYWIGRYGVLYSANTSEPVYQQAIN